MIRNALVFDDTGIYLLSAGEEYELPQPMAVPLVNSGKAIEIEPYRPSDDKMDRTPKGNKIRWLR
jgi:hypothetical protein